MDRRLLPTDAQLGGLMARMWRRGNTRIGKSLNCKNIRMGDLRNAVDKEIENLTHSYDKGERDNNEHL